MKPESKLLSRLTCILRELGSLEIPLRAANASYFLLLSAFPALVLIMSLIRYTPLSLDALLSLLEGLLPEVLLPAVEKLVLNTYQNTSTTMVSVSIVATLWSASRGIHGLLTGLNAVYHVSENRGSLFTRLLSFLYTFAFLIVLVLTLVLHVFGTTILELLENARSPLLQFLTGIIDLRFFLLVFLQTTVFTAMFMALPNQKNRFWDSLPGALLSSIGWLVFSYLFSLYVDHFSNYTGIYGSVYGIALCMLWVYSCVSIIFYGGALNHLLMQSPKKEEK